MTFALFLPLLAHADDLEVKKQVDPRPVAGDARCVARVQVDAAGRPTAADVRGCDAPHAEAAKAAVMQWQWKKLVDQSDATAFVQIPFPAGSAAPQPEECLWRFEVAKTGELTTLAAPEPPCASWMLERLAPMEHLPPPTTCRGVYSGGTLDLSGCPKNAQHLVKQILGGDKRYTFAPAGRNVVEIVIPVDIAPRLFDAAALRDGFVLGTKVRFRIEEAGKEPIEERWEVTGHTDTGCTIASTTVNPTTGALIEDQGEGTSTWEELESHAAFPAHLTSISDSTIIVPAGTFQTVRYTVVQEDGTTKVLHFAKNLPGPPVSMVVTRGKEVVMSMVLLERSAP
ncbi:MAG: hypothetical protein H6735_30245 [Alphaproteobacteria bacterium]|nr:hypothetical protein [Alphaproteobacteria bacterium]